MELKICSKVACDSVYLTNPYGRKLLRQQDIHNGKSPWANSFWQWHSWSPFYLDSSWKHKLINHNNKHNQIIWYPNRTNFISTTVWSWRLFSTYSHIKTSSSWLGSLGYSEILSVVLRKACSEFLGEHVGLFWSPLMSPTWDLSSKDTTDIAPPAVGRAGVCSSHFVVSETSRQRSDLDPVNI